jgi:hypothetical protein
MFIVGIVRVKAEWEEQNALVAEEMVIFIGKVLLAPMEMEILIQIGEVRVKYRG